MSRNPSKRSPNKKTNRKAAAPILGDVIGSEAELMERLATPSRKLVRFIPSVSSPLMLLGAGGKMGPTLALLAQRAAMEAGHKLRIIAASRFSDRQARSTLEAHGLETIACDLLDRKAVSTLPNAENILYLPGMKFGTQTNPSLTWAINTLAPANVCERFPKARIVALSTGNVYPMVDAKSGGAVETTALNPTGEYPNAAIGRERIFDHYSRANGTRVALLRLNYAVDLRYGVLTDIALRVWNRKPIHLGNGWFNCIWQGDANDMILRSLDVTQSPAKPWNMTLPETFSVRETAKQFGELMNRKPKFEGREARTTLISNSAALCRKLGKPAVSFESMVRWTANWIQSGQPIWNKPTGFEVRDGQY